MKNIFATDKKDVTNPYVKGAEGKQLWDDRYMNMKDAIKKWQMAFMGMTIVTILLTFVVAKIATESHVEPFVVETNQGMPYAIAPMESLSSKDQKLVNFAVNEFIINTRTIHADPKAEELILNKAYAYAADNTLSVLQNYFSKNDPYQISKNNTVSVNIINSMPLSDHTWQVTWDETQHFTDNQPPITTRWMADITYRFGEVNPKYQNINPFGFYITDISWSQSQQDENMPNTQTESSLQSHPSTK